MQFRDKDAVHDNVAKTQIVAAHGNGGDVGILGVLPFVDLAI